MFHTTMGGLYFYAEKIAQFSFTHKEDNNTNTLQLVTFLAFCVAFLGCKKNKKKQ